MYALSKVIASQLLNQSPFRLVHTTCVASLDMKWRRQNKLPESARLEPEFRDRPDYSFLDGRPTPLTKNIKLRYEDEKRLAEDAIKYLGHIEYALQRQNRFKLEAEENAQRILSRKLKPKGSAYKPKHSEESNR